MEFCFWSTETPAVNVVMAATRFGRNFTELDAAVDQRAPFSATSTKVEAMDAPMLGTPKTPINIAFINVTHDFVLACSINLEQVFPSQDGAILRLK